MGKHPSGLCESGLEDVICHRRKHTAKKKLKMELNNCELVALNPKRRFSIRGTKYNALLEKKKKRKKGLKHYWMNYCVIW